MRLQGTGVVNNGMKTACALLAVGRAVEVEYKAEMCKKNSIQIPTPTRSGEHGSFTRFGYWDLHAQRAARKYMEDAEEWTSDWTQLQGESWQHSGVLFDGRGDSNTHCER
jgi:DNA-directed RNA polymerase